MNPLEKLTNSRNLEQILTENNSPVARMRLFSDGIQTNNRMKDNEPVTGDKGCLTCGNCIDACPVVREKKRFVFTQNQRTSMSLETIVGTECRRCYACVKSCPQVSKSAKEFVLGFRRGEKFVHAFVATLIFLLAASGIFMFHFNEMIASWQQVLLKLVHVVLGGLLLLAPVLYYLLAPALMKRAFKNVFRFGAGDLEWMKNFGAYLKDPAKRALPSWHEFNTYHKLWFLYLIVIIFVLGTTGILNLLGEGVTGALVSTISLRTHALFALTTDLMIVIHIYFKLLRHLFRNISDMGQCYKKNGSLHYPFLYDSRSQLKETSDLQNL